MLWALWRPKLVAGVTAPSTLLEGVLGQVLSTGGGDAGQETRLSWQPLGDWGISLGYEACSTHWVAEVDGAPPGQNSIGVSSSRRFPHLPGLVMPLSSPGSWTASMAPSS